MDFNELDAIITAIAEREKQALEITRLQTSYFVNCFTSNVVQPMELWPLPWDKKENKKIELPVIDMDRVKKMEERLNNLNKNE